MPTIEALKARIAKANARMQASHSQNLEPGAYGFTITEAREEYIEKRQEARLYLRMLCDGTLTTDTFAYTEEMTWKLAKLLASIGIDFDAFIKKDIDVKDLIGRSGELIAEKHGEKVYYKYQEQG
jgi:hypothetical protein